MKREGVSVWYEEEYRVVVAPRWPADGSAVVS